VALWEAENGKLQKDLDDSNRIRDEFEAECKILRD
jgi:hypothetical protein